MNLQTKRWIVNGISVLVGAAATWFIVYGYIDLGPISIGFGVDARSFAYSNVGILFLSIAGLVWIWLDYFMGTEYLKH